MKISDEMLNKYLDGELSSEEILIVKKSLQKSEELQKRFYALKLVQVNLFKLNVDEVSADFTGRVMSRIGRRRFTVPKQQKYFIFTVASFITILCLLIIGFSISTIVSSSPASRDSLDVVDTVVNFSGGLVDYIKQLFTGKGLSIIGSIFSLVILISAYFFFEMQKRTKADLGNGHHL